MRLVPRESRMVGHPEVRGLELHVGKLSIIVAVTRVEDVNLRRRRWAQVVWMKAGFVI
jgi:hypothetical protein